MWRQQIVRLRQRHQCRWSLLVRVVLVITRCYYEYYHLIEPCVRVGKLINISSKSWRANDGRVARVCCPSTWLNNDLRSVILDDWYVKTHKQTDRFVRPLTMTRTTFFTIYKKKIYLFPYGTYSFHPILIPLTDLFCETIHSIESKDNIIIEIEFFVLSSDHV